MRSSWFERTFKPIAKDASGVGPRRLPATNDRANGVPDEQGPGRANGRADELAPAPTPLRVEDSLDSMIMSLTRLVDGRIDMPWTMVSDVCDLLAMIRDQQLKDAPPPRIEPQSIHADHHLRLVT